MLPVNVRFEFPAIIELTDNLISLIAHHFIAWKSVFKTVAQTRPLFVYFRPFLNTMMKIVK